MYSRSNCFCIMKMRQITSPKKREYYSSIYSYIDVPKLPESFPECLIPKCLNENPRP